MYQSRKIKLSIYSNQLKNKYAELFYKRCLSNLLRKIIVKFLLIINCVIIIHIFIDILMFEILIQLIIYGILSFLFTTILYFLIDRYVEN